MNRVTSPQSLEEIIEADNATPAWSSAGSRAVKPVRSTFKPVQLQLIQRPSHLDCFSRKIVSLIEIITKTLGEVKWCQPISCAAMSDTQEILGHQHSILQK